MFKKYCLVIDYSFIANVSPMCRHQIIVLPPQPKRRNLNAPSRKVNSDKQISVNRKLAVPFTHSDCSLPKQK